MTEEEFRDIPGYEGMYQVSNLGNVKSLNYRGNGNEQLLKQDIDSRGGYKTVSLFKNKKYKKYYVHRLIGITFIINPNNYPVINHINGIRFDNRVENLEFCTNSYNVKDGFNRGRKKPSPWFGKFDVENSSSKKVLQYDLNKILIKKWNSQAEASRILKIMQSNISSCCVGRRKTCGGYIWKYDNK